MWIYCRQCDEPNELPRQWINATDACVHCQAKDWEVRNTPKVPYVLNHNDQRLLRGLRIARD